MSSAKPSPLTIPPELEAEMTPAVRAFVESLLDRIRKLEARLGMNPQNSSLPPSTQHPHARPQPPKRKSKKKRGGQPGHEKHERPLIPTEQCDDVQTAQADRVPPLWREARRAATRSRCGIRCGNCPRSSRIVTEYQRHRLTCPCCGETTCAELPARRAAGPVGAAVDGA